MKKLRFINSLIAVMFMAVALAACSSSSKDDDDDDDDDDKKSEKLSKKGDKEDEEEIKITAASGVEGFCNILDQATEAVANASSESEIENLQYRFKDSLTPYKNDTTPLSADDKERVSMSLAMFFGTVMDKALEFGYGDQDLTEDELYETGVELGQQIRALVEGSNSLAEVCSNLDNM